MAEVTLHGLIKTFGNVEAVKDVSLDVLDREFYCILGPSGAGKTTILRCIAGLEMPDEGDVFIDGVRVNNLHPSLRDVGMFFQNLSLYPNKSGFENIAYPLRVKGVPKSEIKQRVRQVAETLGITHLLDRRPGTFSGGERQRVALGRVIIRQPQVYLLDEPLSNLDAQLRLSLRAEFKHLQHHLGQTTVYITPDHVEALALGDRICVLNNGIVQQIDTPLNIYNHPANKFVAEFIGSPPMNILPCVPNPQDGRLTIEAETFTLDITRFQAKLNDHFHGRAMYLGVRPEDVQIHSTPSTDGIPATIYAIEPLGAKTIVDLDLDGTVIKSVEHGDVSHEVGAKKTITFQMDRIHLIDKDSEAVII